MSDLVPRRKTSAGETVLPSPPLAQRWMSGLCPERQSSREVVSFSVCVCVREAGCQLLAEKGFNFKLERTGFSFQETALCLLGTKKRENEGPGVGLARGLVVPSITVQHGEVSLGGVDRFLCLKHGLLLPLR